MRTGVRRVDSRPGRGGEDACGEGGGQKYRGESDDALLLRCLSQELNARSTGGSTTIRARPIGRRDGVAI
jgi:hypothetical protein